MIQITEDCGCGSKGEGNMAKHQAMECADDAQDVANMIEESDNLPEWLEAKITLAADYMNKVKDYLTHHVRGAEPAPSRNSDLKSTLKALIPERIEKTDVGYFATSSTGKRLSKQPKSLKAAIKQLAAVHINKGK